MTKRKVCPKCKKYELVPAAGPMEAEITIVGPYPGDEEMKLGEPWVGPAGKALEAELRLVGIELDECRRTNLWLHPKDKECDLEWHTDQAWDEISGGTYVLLLGADTAKILLDRKISEISGLPLKPKQFEMPISVKKLMAVVNPADATLGSVGELRLGIQRFANMIRKAGYGRSIS